MKTTRHPVRTTVSLILFSGLLIYIKDRQEKVYWRDITDKIESQMEPRILPVGEQDNRPRDELASDVETLIGRAPAGVKEPQLRPDDGAAARTSLQNFTRFLGVSP